MKGFLVRAGIDHSCGHWNAPVDPFSGNFVYVPIPEAVNLKTHPGLERSFQEALPSLKAFCTSFKCDLSSDLKFPSTIVNRFMHLDPDFKELTYGDVGDRRGRGIAKLKNGDLIAFYSGLKPVRDYKDRLLYALIGIYIVEEVVFVDEVPQNKWRENAHTRRIIRGVSDIVVRAKRSESGRLEKCIPIGEWRRRAYRVKKELIEEWGGLNVNDGYIQRSAVPPSFLNPKKFIQWFQDQGVKLIQENN